MKFSKAQNEAVQRVFDLVVGADRGSRRSRKATLAKIQKISRELKAELRIKEDELELCIFADDQDQLLKDVKRLKKEMAQTTEMYHFIAKFAADKQIAGEATATLL
jgi:DNA repair protein RadC